MSTAIRYSRFAPRNLKDTAAAAVPATAAAGRTVSSQPALTQTALTQTALTQTALTQTAPNQTAPNQFADRMARQTGGLAQAGGRAQIGGRAQAGGLAQIGGLAKTGSLHPAVFLLLICIALPFYFTIGSLWLTPNRLVLLLFFFPASARWLSGAAGRVRLADFCVIGLCIWGAIAMFASDGTNTIQFSGMATVETFGAYMIGRAYIRTEAQYIAAMRLLGLIILLLVPGAIVESITGFRLYNRIFDPVLHTFPWADYEKRLHMFRAQTVFEHPILYGVFTAFAFAPLFAIARLRAGRLQSWISASPSIFATFFCLSMGAYLGVMIQLMLMAWGLILRNVRNHWKILGGLMAAAYVIVDMLSNRTPFQVFSSYVTFDAHTAYWRVLIFKYGMENVWAHPIFGLGAFVNDWKRPDWMFTSTVDNLWLVFTLRYGIPGFFLILGSFMAVLVGLMRARLTDPALRAHRDALAFSFLGLGIAICTVHLWNATFIFMMFMLGASAWLSDVESQDQTGSGIGSATGSGATPADRASSPARATGVVRGEPARRGLDQTGLSARQPRAR